jgi:hypothetical protein
MTFRLSFLTLGLAAWLTTSAIADDVEVLARGPVHEGYAEPSEREPAATPIVPKQPPKPIEELPPDQKPEGDNLQWIPGYWAWDEDKKDFIWISGFWRNAPPGRSWVAGSWRKAGDGWQWSGGFWADAKTGPKAQVEYLPQPPKPLDEKGPVTPAASETQVYVPGSWVWRERYVWRPGFWSDYRPGWVWVSAHYRWTPAGYVFIDGYWDYPLAERGILFAPAYIPAAVYVTPGYVYTPTVVVREECLFGAFFCRRGFGCYYFGDYFAPAYAGIGFVSWGGHISASITIGGWHDPLFSYYRIGFRSDPFWRTGIHDLYAGRFRGDFMRPPTTFVKQTTVINNITNVNNSKNVNLNNVTMLSTLKDAGAKRTLQPVAAAERQAFQQSARNVREIADRRATAETTLAAKGPVGNTARSLTLDVPQHPTAGRTGSSVKVADPTSTGSKSTSPGKGDATIHVPSKTPTTSKGDSTSHPDSKVPGMNPLPKGNSTPKTPPPPPKASTVAPPKSSTPPPKSSPSKQTKASSPNTLNLARSPAVARGAAPAAVRKPAPRPQTPAFSRANAVTRKSTTQAARPAAPKKTKK